MKNQEVKKASDYLYDTGLGLDPKSDELIIEAIESYHKDQLAKIIEELKFKEIAYLAYIRENLLDTTKGDEIKYVSAQKDATTEIISKIENINQKGE